MIRMNGAVTGGGGVEGDEESQLLISESESDPQSHTFKRRGRRRSVRCTTETILRTNHRIFLVLIFALFFIMITMSNVSEVIINAAETELLFLKLNPFIDSYIRPGNESCLICPRHMQLECQDLPLSEEDRLMVFFVTSAPANWENREVIRATWATVASPKPVFITGYTSDLAVMDRLVAEARKFQDIIVEDFLDSYRNLTVKTGFILKHFLSLCSHADFLIKTDDDMFIQPARFQEVLAQADADQVTGDVQVGAVPYRDPWSKYYLPEWLYNGTLLPNFTSGWTYVLPGRRVQEIYEASFTVPMINLEDVFFTGLVAGRTLNLTMVHDKRFRTKSFYGHNVCLYKPYAAFHRLPHKKLMNVWPRVQNLTLEICDRVLAAEEGHSGEKREKKEEQKKYNAQSGS